MSSTASHPGRAATEPCSVSIVIKALNEEKNICAAIESSLAAVAEVGGEVILADSHSSDRTVELASRYPIRIVQLANPDERCCGVGPQLGYQHARGDYVYVLDGDMQLARGFLPEALNFMALHPEVAGVGGLLLELNTESIEFRERALRGALSHMAPGEVDRLDCGGLYRRHAIEESGYLSDRNMHSYEEFELGARLRALGWKLWRIPVDVGTHKGHDMPAYRLLLRRWNTRFVCGGGELLRGALGQPHMRLVWRDLRELRLYTGVLAWWCLMLATPFIPVPAVWRAGIFGVLLVAPLLAMTVRKRSFARAAYSVASWCFAAAGLVRGLLQPRRAPAEPIRSRILQEPSQAMEPGREQHA